MLNTNKKQNQSNLIGIPQPPADAGAKSFSQKGVGCLHTLLEMALFVGNKKMAKQIAKDNMKSILLMQIDDEGKQPAELNRTKAFGYSVYNLRKIVDFALIMEQVGVKFYKKQNKIDSAFEYLLQFVGNHNAFPYKQINSWEGYEKQLKKNISRLVRVSSRKSLIADMAQDMTENTPKSIVGYVY